MLCLGRNKAHFAVNGEFETASAAITLSAGWCKNLRCVTSDGCSALVAPREAPIVLSKLPVATVHYREDQRAAPEEWLRSANYGSL